MGSEGERKVRIEAGDRRLRQLTPEQEAAAMAARALLDNYASLTPPESRPESWYLPWVDHQRGNPVVLLDGGRGSGKSTVLLSLVRVWAEPWDPRMSAPPGGKADAEAWESDKKALDAPEFVPLDVLDLQTLPNDASLLFRVAGLFQRVVAATATHSRCSDGARTAARPREAWRRLVTAIATGWEGATKGRNQQVDPEIFALELEKAERQGLDVAIEFRRFIDQLIDGFMELRRGHFPKDGPRRPLFIVPIDDADMNPQKTPELVKLMRLIWHPRVAFLLAGKTEHFLAALERDYRAGKDLSDPEEARAYAQELFNRVVPPDQRLGFTQLSNKRRPDLTASGLKKKGQDETAKCCTYPDGSAPKAPQNESVRELLERIGLPQLDPGDPKRSLWNILDNNPIGERALPGVLRELQDLRGRLARISSLNDDARPPKWWQALETLWGFALRRQAYSPAVMRRVQDMIRYDETGLVVAAGEVEWERSTAAMHRFHLTTKDATLVLQRWFSPCGKLQIAQGAPAVEIPEQVAAVLLLATDLVAEGHGSFVGSSPAHAMARAGLVTLLLQNEEGKTLELPWPLPRWDASWPYLELEERWRACVRDESFGWLDTARFARTAATYLRLIGEVATGAKTEPAMVPADQLTAKRRASNSDEPPRDAAAVASTSPALLEGLSKLNNASRSRHSAPQKDFVENTVWLLCEATSGLDVKLEAPQISELIAAVAPPKPAPKDLERVLMSHYRDVGIKKLDLEYARGLLAQPSDTVITVTDDRRDATPSPRSELGAAQVVASPEPSTPIEPATTGPTAPEQTGKLHEVAISDVVGVADEVEVTWTRFEKAAAAVHFHPDDYLEKPGSLAYYLSPARLDRALPWWIEAKASMTAPAELLEARHPKTPFQVSQAMESLRERFGASTGRPLFTLRSRELNERVAIHFRAPHRFSGDAGSRLIEFLASNHHADYHGIPVEVSRLYEMGHLPLLWVDGAPVWPAVAWLAPIDQQLLLAAWGDIFSPTPIRVPESEIGDLLSLAASRYLWAAYDIATRRVLSGDAPAISAAVQALRGLELEPYTNREHPPPRAAALKAFVDSLGLLATPEARLPLDDAGGLLKELDDTTFKDLDARRHAIHVEQEPANHPWVVRKRELGIKP